jgi:hypothetical protein
MQRTAMAEGSFVEIESRPDDIIGIFMYIWKDFVALYRKWDSYMGLCGKPENFAVINALPQAFNVIEESLRSDMTMTENGLAIRCNRTRGGVRARAQNLSSARG